jgi:hypothetical protein
MKPRAESVLFVSVSLPPPVGASPAAFPFATFIPFDFPMATGRGDLGPFVCGTFREQLLACVSGPDRGEGTPLSLRGFRNPNDPSRSIHRRSSQNDYVVFGEKFERNDGAACKR